MTFERSVDWEGFEMDTAPGGTALMAPPAHTEDTESENPAWALTPLAYDDDLDEDESYFLEADDDEDDDDGYDDDEGGDYEDEDEDLSPDTDTDDDDDL